MSGRTVCSNMPEKGWSILTVRTATAKRVKELARRGGVTVDEYINALMAHTTRAEWAVCKLCGVKVKSTNLQDHMAKVHPKRI